jgi:subtilisin-like proprotein convertase family protein
MMWRRSLLLTCAALVPLAIAVPTAGAATFANTTPISIPAGAPDTTDGPASPYPSTISVAGIPGNVADVNVTLNGLTHTCMSDTRFLLVGPGGQNSILLSTAGGYCNDPVANAVITLDDEAPTSYPCNVSPSGTFKPTADPITPPPAEDCTPADNNAFPAPAPAAPYPAALSSFDGHPADGAWSLFVLDQFGGDSGSLAGWSLDLTAGACAGKTSTSGALVGTSGNDNLVGSAGPDVLIGNGGRDTIKGIGGNDVICGGPGKDTLLGGAGKDLIRGEGGKDKLKGQGGKDTCVGGPGKDTAKACEKDKSI